MDVNIMTLDGSEFNLSDISVQARDFIVSSIETVSEFEEIEGRHGVVESEPVYAQRTIAVPFHYRADDYVDFSLIRDELFRKVTTANPFYIRELRRKERDYGLYDETGDDFFVGRRYLVRVQNVIEIEQAGFNGLGEIVFQTVELPFAESVGTTLDPRTFDAEVWQVGQGLTAEDLSYAHSTTNFEIYNAGDIAIDPRQMDVKIRYQGASNGLTIVNNTTGDEWSYSGASGANDTILLDGIRSLKNGASIFGDTNKKLITIEKGWNDFTLSGTSGSFLISFEFKFYYL